MRTIHKMRISWPDGYTKDECVENLVDNILARFPDALVLSAPVEVGEETINDVTTVWIEQQFTSDFFDGVTASVLQMVMIELEGMRDCLYDDDSPFSKPESDFVKEVLNSVIDHLSHKFFGEVDCDH